MRKTTGKLLDANTGLHECGVCGKRWVANIKPDTGGGIGAAHAVARRAA
ncbi:MAG: hypothetical protein V1909_03875 [Candidatus Micrarchaeota archaeon]